MGINSNYSIYGMKDYAAEFSKKANENSIRMDQMLKDAGITVPIGKSDKKDDNKGLVLEHETQDKEQIVKPEKRDDLGNLALKENRKAAEEKIKNEFLQYGKANGEKVEDEKEAEKLAKAYVKDKAYEQESDRTTVFIDKEQYKAAEKDRDQKFDELYQQYRDQGLRRRQARKRANAELEKLEYVKNKHTRAFVENHEEMFYDEDGNFSSDKFKRQAVDWANTHTRSDEAENHYLSLKERREVAAKYGTDDDIISDIANKANIGYEKDYTPLIRTTAVVVGTAAGLALGSTVLSPSSSASAVSESVAGSAGNAVAGSGAVATAEASVNGTLAGGIGGLGIGAGLSPLLKDRGNKEPRIYEPGKPQPEEPPTPPVPEKPETCTLTPDQDVKINIQSEIVDTPIDYCSYEVNKRDTWYGIVRAKYRHEDGTPLTQKEMKEVWTGLKEMHNIPKNLTYIPMKELRLYSEINGKKYLVDCDNNLAEEDKYRGQFAAVTQKWKGQDPGVQTKRELKFQHSLQQEYWYTDCDGNKSKIFYSPDERNTAMRAEQNRINAELNK